ncbi:hypothetical protein [Bacillus infantis]|uniref:hypothetical protein n=1 Tax=Bacillus infantis TaxID=324767 RepID=UPI003CEDCA8B
MPYRIIPCKNKECDAKHIKLDIVRPWVGYFNYEPVYEHSHTCKTCNYKHVIRLYHSSTNWWYEKVTLAEMGLVLRKYTVVEYQQELLKLEEAQKELDKANERIREALNL